MCCDLITLSRLFSLFYEICDCMKTFVCHKNHDDCSEAKFLPIFPTCIDAYCLINIKRQLLQLVLVYFLDPDQIDPSTIFRMSCCLKKGTKKK